MVKQNKGKDLHKVPQSKLSQGPYYVSKKYDGHYIQIQLYKNIVTMTTSGGKEFYLSGLADYIKQNFTEDFHIECEYNYNCRGLLGDRGKSAVLTIYRTAFSKNIPVSGNPFKDTFRVLDMIGTDLHFSTRYQNILDMFGTTNQEWFMIPKQILVENLETAQNLAKEYVKMGYEGAMLKTPRHVYTPGKRVNSIIKIKPRLTADLLCVDTKEGTGKYEGMVGSLLLKDSKGRHVWAGSGLDDAQRQLPLNMFVGHVVEIEYERIDETYIQPIIKHIRYDKTEEEID